MQCIAIKRGLNIGPTGSLFPAVDAAPVRSVALLGIDFPGIKPALTVAQGDRVKLGDVLFTDRADQRLCGCAPATGIVSAIHLGPRRSLQALVIEVTEDVDEYPVTQPIDGFVDVAGVRKLLQQYGMWSFFRMRPYDVIPATDAVPANLFVTAMDTHPFALNPVPIIQANTEAFAAGIEKLSLLAGQTYVCMAYGSETLYPDTPGVTAVAFDGPHPSGLPGTHIHYLTPHVSDAWYIGYQDVIAIGHLFLNGRITVGRDISAAGPGLDQPLQLRTRAGAAVGDLLGNRVPANSVSSGSALHEQRDTLVGSYLGRYHNQVWVSAPVSHAPAKPSTMVSWLHQLASPRTAEDVRCSGEGVTTGMLSLEAFDAVWPFSIPLVPLLRAILTGDTATANDLGATMLAADDLALCSYICPAKQDYGAALSATLQAYEKEG